jgi:hypothetical protein
VRVCVCVCGWQWSLRSPYWLSHETSAQSLCCRSARFQQRVGLNSAESATCRIFWPWAPRQCCDASSISFCAHSTSCANSLPTSLVSLGRTDSAGDGSKSDCCVGAEEERAGRGSRVVRGRGWGRGAGGPTRGGRGGGGGRPLTALGRGHASEDRLLQFMCGR